MNRRLYTGWMRQLLFFRTPSLLILLSLLSVTRPVLAEASNVQGSPIEFIINDERVRSNIELHLEATDGVVPFSALGLPRSNEFIVRKTKKALEALGYYQPDIQLEGGHQGWRLTVEPGSPVVWDDFVIQITGNGKDTGVFKEFVSSWPMSVGQRMSHDDYERQKRKLAQIARDNGYFQARFLKTQLEVNPSINKARIHWSFDTGTQYKISSVSLTQTEYSEELLKRFIKIKPEQYYAQQDVVRTQQALNRSGYFNRVDVEQTLDDENHLVAIEIRLQDTEKYVLKTDIGYGTDSGGRFGISWQDLRVNDRGHNYLIGFTTNEIENVTSFQYKIPIANSQDEWLNRFSYRYKDDQVAISKTSTIESRLILRHTDHWSTQWAGSLSSQSISSDTDIISYLEYLVPSVQVNYLSVIDPFAANEGWRWQGELRIGNESLSDPDLNFIQLEQKFKFIWKVSDNWRVLLRSNIAYTDMDTDEFITRMPTHYRYLAGGDASVRGYKYQTLSPSDNDGNLIGGKHLVTSSIELDWQFAEQWRWAWFADTGNAFNDYSNMDLKRSAGTGLRWLTPVGAIRIDYARAMDSPEKWRLHITLGPDL